MGGLHGLVSDNKALVRLAEDIGANVEDLKLEVTGRFFCKNMNLKLSC